MVAMRAFSAKVWASSSTFSTAFAGMDWDWGAGAKGFAAGLLLDVEKGFAAAAEPEPGDEKGLAFWLVWEGFTPKRDSPMLVCLGLGSSAGCGACSDVVLS